MDSCGTPYCPGDPRWASPGHGHRAECPWPKPYDGPPLDPEIPDLAPALAIVLLFAAAHRTVRPEQKQKLLQAKELLSTATPLSEVAQAILDARGPHWLPDEETLTYIRLLKDDHAAQ